MGKRTSIVPIMGRRIRDRRVAMGFSRKQLSTQAGISEPTLWRLEAGKANASSGVIVALADALMMTADYMLGR